ncbi:cytochrome c oxidase assembly protein COX20, mitochondrial isoform X2 [Saimiri boliviensis]|uniref:cytochrome c oxidase assembly protein COX20, mitochondrial isoform X2 n=1 Tax=Saimiri boliviensis TaxID=27679 RepID=UPI003D772D33
MAVGAEGEGRLGRRGREVERSGSVPPRPARNQGAGLFPEPFSFCAPGPAGCVPDREESVTRSMEQRTWRPRRRRAAATAEHRERSLRWRPSRGGGAGRAAARRRGAGRGAAGRPAAPGARAAQGWRRRGAVPMAAVPEPDEPAKRKVELEDHVMLE